MKLSTTWLNDYVDVCDLSPQRLSDALTNAGLEVEGGIEYRGAQFKQVIVAQVLRLDPHPNADKLRLVTVDCGAALGQTQVVCGAPNVAEGQLIAFALNGANVFSTKQNQWFTLSPAVIRGVASEGMICSLEELALSGRYPSADGIWVLNDVVTPAQVGQRLEEALALEAEAILETAPTANRGDWMSYLGVAREISALFERPLKPIQSLSNPSMPTLSADAFRVVLSDSSVCEQYHGVLLTQVKVQPSPDWVQRRLEASGIRSINNVVDVTNLVMLEMGQPLHAFDALKLGLAGEINVRRAKSGERLLALDEATYDLDETQVVVTCQDQPVALAGLMGGASTGIDEATHSVFLEAAYFPSASTRRSARATGIRSESSARFERGVDAGGVERALWRALYLLQEWSGAHIEGHVQAGAMLQTPVLITLPLSQVTKVIGQDYSRDVVVNGLTRLGFSVDEVQEDALQVQVPSFRQRDVQKPIDLIEEVVRIAGYDGIGETFPVSQKPVQQSVRRRILADLRHILTGLGLNESLTTSLLGTALMERLGVDFEEASLVKLLNSHSSEHTLMRQSLLPTLLESCLTNVQQGSPTFNTFEIGRRYFKRGKASFKNTGVQESLSLAVLLCEQEPSAQWINSPSPDFYTLKGILEALLKRFSLDQRAYFTSETQNDFFHTGRCTLVSLQGVKKPLAILGQLHPKIQKRLKLKAPIFMFELDADLFIKTVEQQASAQQMEGVPDLIRLSPYPEMERDLAVLVPKTLTHQCIVDSIEHLECPSLQRVDVFDQYEGKGIEVGYRSLAYRFVWQAPDRTLTDQEVDTQMTQIRTHLVNDLALTLR